MTIKPTSASLLISEQCNLRCKYCFELGSHRDKMMSDEIIIRSMEMLFENAVEQGKDSVSIILFGGEPLLNPKGCNLALSKGIELREKTGVNFSASCITNGTVLNEYIYNMFKRVKKEIDLTIQISVDGVKEAHDMNRVTRTGGGSFDLIEKNIPKWKQICTDENGNMSGLCIHGCLSPSNMKYFYQSYRYFMDVWQTPFIWFMPIHNADYSMEDVIMYKNDLKKIAEENLKLALKTGSLKYITDYAPIDKCIETVYCGEFGAPCGAGKNFCSITADGMISPCHNIYTNDKENYTLIGNIWDGVDPLRVRLMNDYSNEDLNCTKENPNCNCYGCYRCLADNWVVNGNIFTQIRGNRCLMSHVERDIQQWLHKELAKAGLIENRSGEEL